MKNNTRTILVLQGIPASGKSCFAKKWVEEYPEERVRFNNDDIRNMLGKYWVPGKREKWMVEQLKQQFFESAMSGGYNIVVDNMNLNPKEIEWITNLANNWNYNEFKYEVQFKKFFNVPLEECIRRDAERRNPIGADVITGIYKKYRDYMSKDHAIENCNKSNKLNDKGLPEVILVDIDNTLAYNVLNRPWWGDPEKVLLDVPNFPMFKLLKDKTNIIIVTGREETDQMISCTTKWLNDNGIYPIEYHGRPIGDFRPGPEVKLDIYNKYIKDKYYVQAVFEDNTKCVNMYRELGLMCLQNNEDNI